MRYKDLIEKYGNGLMSSFYYEEICKELEPLCPCNLLVFGLGNDSFLWHNLNKDGTTVFIEDDIEWISNFENSDLNIIPVKYNTFVEDYKILKYNESKLTIELPENITNKEWDFIFVDGPLGHQPPRPWAGPGRMKSLYTAFTLIKNNGVVVVDDFSRPIENNYTRHFFGKDNIYKVINKKIAFVKSKK